MLPLLFISRRIWKGAERAGAKECCTGWQMVIFPPSQAIQLLCVQHEKRERKNIPDNHYYYYYVYI